LVTHGIQIFNDFDRRYALFDSLFLLKDFTIS